MTVIAYRNRIMAADGRCTSGQMVVVDDWNKLRRLRDGSLLGSAGSPFHAAEYKKWLDTGADPAKRPNLRLMDNVSSGTVIVVRPDLTVEEHDAVGIMLLGRREFYATGSGYAEAFAAMEAGATAIEAVKIVCLRNVYCGGRIRSLTL